MDYFVFFIETEGAGCVEDIRDVALSVVIAVEVKHLEELFTVLFSEDWVFVDYVPSEYELFVFLGVFFATVEHFKI